MNKEKYEDLMIRFAKELYEIEAIQNVKIVVRKCK
jgi:hypothetical protein